MRGDGTHPAAYPHRYHFHVLATFQMTCVAFVRSTGGTVRLLLSLDRDGEPMFEGQPVLLAELRPGSAPASIRIEGPDAMPADAVAVVADSAATQIAALVEAAHGPDGSFDGNRMIGQSCAIAARVDQFDLDQDDG